ncbi:hypothetical protein CesoFtcFv8_013310 [Champsocephalus esox]|uniref:Uncharacterized protein n=1 Tax=Champsocephalus esox TaxID=159716 RepID=A0AAN8BW38_9TELE|nr:hypothetical protein CesoFtcFv8_013310 [Champsocephalus esox]
MKQLLQTSRAAAEEQGADSRLDDIISLSWIITRARLIMFSFELAEAVGMRFTAPWQRNACLILPPGVQENRAMGSSVRP